ncbi:hypothetical protein [Lewinella cohaerens]|uniref:hypothetical protein n=1 Tax=Lewinella cohaerens TaxID=70995 RepID=UPI00037F8BD9|nr:hypothetical protein [Lewinella cohaerens]
MKALTFTFFLLFGALLLQAQSYDISQYQARYERRPFLEINPSLNYSGTFSDLDDFVNHGGGGNLIIDWREQSSLDNRIRNISVSGQAQFFRQEFKDHDRVDISQKGASLFASIEQYNYTTEKKFWGFRGGLLMNAQDRDDFQLNSNRFTDISLEPGLFFGTGRIEFAEDALLANWMMDDLLEQQVIGATTSEQRESLAKRITSIIGNRTFDFRRRRIYELQQLQQLFTEENIAIDNEFMLFAVLNDNWAFANRASLPRGKRWQFGVDAGGLYHYESQPFAGDEFTVSGRPYANYTSGKIIGDNASSIWTAELSAYYQTDLEDSNFPFAGGERYGGQASFSHRLVWLPISRTTLSWTNQVAGQLGTRTPNGTADGFKENRLSFISNLSWDYFVTYNWSFVLNVGLAGQFNDQDFFDFHTVRPSFNFSTRYAIF